ncbi:Rieske (2Fe-2S) protein [Cellulomonas hominis]|uniref:Cytochrome bc1 complex Rieske iron-sulfur subunit n=1 Tax=Cellulomonas hominis TaxID=156981 RepID=A0A511FGF4_9CELL|nr:Rieske 2Fe-2S domain-containing protein [Cellulomonas hominis]MBB5475435.1 ubiquinol-cytochrome c reductase iron-sulfur subunit [Cellulomonas hominis]MBU5423112.1 Rieske (2Fe-2S) protein [Cellulomonas hominis]NKY07002.1 Rieske (2Fe-2S) protein [Cellulomonas hominis]GEL48272.1 ubiquinol-cytochrome c reductase [Cellulomonas hominis]
MSNDNTGTDVTTRADGTLPERFEDPGHPEHHERRGDTDPKANKRAERQVVVLFTVSILGTIGAIVAYALVPPGETVGSMRLSNLLLGLGLFLGLAGIGVAAVHWAKALMNDREQSEERHSVRTSEPNRAAAVEALKAGAKDSAIGRRGVLKGAMVTSLALFPLAIAVPLVGNLGGDWNVARSKHTMWRRGTRLTIDPSGRPIKAADVTIGSVFHVIPDKLDEAEHPLNEKAKAVVLLIRMDPRDIKSEQGEGWSYDGIVAFSKICTHVGCPVALYEQQTHHILCPCHQSTFDAADGAKVVFGPAHRPLPQLPITVDDEGYLVAQDGFSEPIGPSFWERLT